MTVQGQDKRRVENYRAKKSILKNQELHEKYAI